MTQKTATVYRVMVEISQKVCIFVVKDIYYAMRNRIDLFSRVKSGKFSSDENKLTYPNHILLWRGLLLILVLGLPEPTR